jgi:hypothetical protein
MGFQRGPPGGNEDGPVGAYVFGRGNRHLGVTEVDRIERSAEEYDFSFLAHKELTSKLCIVEFRRKYYRGKTSRDKLKKKRFGGTTEKLWSNFKVLVDKKVMVFCYFFDKILFLRI